MVPYGIMDIWFRFQHEMSRRRGKEVTSLAELHIDPSPGRSENICLARPAHAIHETGVIRKRGT